MTIDIARAYEQYATQIRRYVTARIGDVVLADDICAQVWLEVCEHAHTYEDRASPVSSWLYRIANSRVIDEARRRKRRLVMIPLDEHAATVEPPADPIDLSWWPRLSAYHQQAIVLALLGYDRNSGSAVLGISPKGYTGVLHRAREKARPYLADWVL